MEKTKREKLNERKADLGSKMKAMITNTEKEDRAFDPEEQAAFDELKAQVEDINSRLSALESSDSVDEEVNSSQGRKSSPVGSEYRFGINTGGKPSYSMVRAIQQMSDPNGPRLNGYEREVSDEIATRSGKSPRGFYVPISSTQYPDMSTRVLNTTTGAGGLVEVLSSDFIELLRNKMVCIQAGAKTLTANGSTFSIPSLTGGATVGWVAESTAASASNQTIAKVTFTPHTISAHTIISRKFMLQVSNMDAEAFVREDLAQVLALGEDLAALNGSGSNDQPTGLLQDSDIATTAIGTNGGAPTYALMVGMETSVANSNADVGALAYVTSPKGRGKLKTTQKATNYPEYLWEKDNTVNGYAAYASNQIPSNLTKASGSNLTAVIFGNWNDLVFAQWGAIDVIADPYSLSTAGDVRISIFHELDVQVRHNGSFVKLVDLDPA